MEFTINFFIIPLLIPVVLAGKSFLDHQDLKYAFAELVSKRTIILTLLALAFAFILQLTMSGKLL